MQSSVPLPSSAQKAAGPPRVAVRRRRIRAALAGAAVRAGSCWSSRVGSWRASCAPRSCRRASSRASPARRPSRSRTARARASASRPAGRTTSGSATRRSPTSSRASRRPASASSARRATPTALSASRTGASTRCIPRSRAPGCRSWAATAATCSPQLSRPQLRELRRTCPRRWSRRSPSSRTARCSTTATPSATPRSSGTGSGARRSASCSRSRAPTPSARAAARSRPRSRSSATRPGGLTTSPLEKLRQMASASLRAYQDGEETAGARRRIVVDYLNSIPLAAAPPWGEVIGIGDALSIWYGADFDETNAILANVDDPRSPFAARDARARLQAGALAGALRGPPVVLPDPGPRGAARARPTPICVSSASEHVISPALRDAALATDLELRDRGNDSLGPPPDDRKTASAVRARLVALLGLSDYYALDRLDLSVKSTVVPAVQEDVTRVLRDLRDPEVARAAGAATASACSTRATRARSSTASRCSSAGAAQRAARAGRQPRPALRRERRREARPRLDRQAAHARDLPRDRLRVCTSASPASTRRRSRRSRPSRATTSPASCSTSCSRTRTCACRRCSRTRSTASTRPARTRPSSPAAASTTSRTSRRRTTSGS